MVIVLFAAMLALIGTTAAAAPRVRIISASEAETMLGSATILDARERAAFEAGHIPGSRPIDWRDFTLEKPGAWNALFGDSSRWGKVPRTDQTLQEKLRALGLSGARPILVVGAPHGWGEEGRIAWNLLYWGAQEGALLDGGYAAWASDGRRGIETGPDRPRDLRAGDFTIRLQPERRIELAALRAELKRGVRPILDARTLAEFEGKKLTGQKRGGHLPGSHLVPASALYRADGSYVGATELEATLSGAAAGSPISYCPGGVRSALLAVLIEARLGTVVANYDGSMWEWSAKPELPLQTSR